MQSVLELSVSAHLTATSIVECAKSEVESRLVRDERGEGVISAAIAVLIMAVLGGMMFIAYKATFTNSSTKVDKVINDITG